MTVPSPTPLIREKPASAKAPVARRKLDDRAERSRQANRALERLVNALNTKVSRARPPVVQIREDSTLSMEAAAARKQTLVRVLVGLAAAAIVALGISWLAASARWESFAHGARLVIAQHEATTLAGRVAELDQQVSGLTARAEAQANYLAELRLSPDNSGVPNAEAKAAAIDADLNRLVRLERRMREDQHNLGKEIVALQAR